MSEKIDWQTIGASVMKTEMIVDEYGILKTAITDEERKDIEAWLHARWNLSPSMFENASHPEVDDLEVDEPIIKEVK